MKQEHSVVVEGFAEIYGPTLMSTSATSSHGSRKVVFNPSPGVAFVNKEDAEEYAVVLRKAYPGCVVRLDSYDSSDGHYEQATSSEVEDAMLIRALRYHIYRGCENRGAEIKSVGHTGFDPHKHCSMCRAET